MASQAEMLEKAKRIVDKLQGRKLQVGRGAESLQRFSIFDKIPPEEKDQFLKCTRSDPVVERAVGSIVGMAVADALGAPLEFLPACEPGHCFILETMKYEEEFNKFGLKRGQWTDDCSMGLCMADSLMLKGGYDGSDIRVRFWNWWEMGYNNAFRLDKGKEGSVGLGGNISKSLYAIRDSNPEPRYDAKTEDSGNGSLMRLTPIPIYFHQDLKKAAEMSYESSYTTHPGPIAAEVCGFVGYVIARALTRPVEDKATSQKQSAADFLDLCTREYLEIKKLKVEPDAPPLDANRILWQLLTSSPPSDKEKCWNWRDKAGPFIVDTLKARGSRYNGYPNSGGYFGSYAVDGLAVALHAVYHTDSFMGAVVKCVNFLGDADSHGSICGQIAGAFYGHCAIDERCLQNLRQWDNDEVALRGALLCVLGREATEGQTSCASSIQDSPMGGGYKAAKDVPKAPVGKEKMLEAHDWQEEMLQAEEFSMFQIQPRDSCPHLGKVGSWRVSPSARCAVCSEDECWVCCESGKILCSRYKNSHMLEHANATSQFVALSLSDLSFWCFKCDAYLDVYKIPQLQPMYKECHIEKFGEEPPMPTISLTMAEPGTGSSSSSS